jgi:hypothetical protein
MIPSKILKIFLSMKKFFKLIFVWVYIKIHTIIINISLALYHSEKEILKADPNDLTEKDKKNQRMMHRNPFVEMMLSGVRQEKLISDYYEILKKADKFIRNATPRQMAVAADKYGTSYGMKDQYGRTFEHYGFFDEKHKNAGKTLAEVLEKEYDERRTKDDDLELIYIFNNKPIMAGMAKFYDAIEKSKTDNTQFEVTAVKSLEFPLKIERENKDVTNKIEQLTEFLHIKKIGFEYRQLEFFIPLKFHTIKLSEGSEIFKEIINIKEVYIRDEYGQLHGFAILKYLKRINYKDTHEVFKFEGIEMEIVGIH